MRFDTYIGMGYSNAISLFMIVATAVILNAHGITDIQTSAQAAEALRPIAGVFTFALFAAGFAAFPNLTGKNFSPHVTIGLGTTGFLDAMLAEPFTAFTFSPVSAAVFQFGNYGAARKRLKAFPATG
jgi:Natural resistance-associated macrophage protein